MKPAKSIKLLFILFLFLSQISCKNKEEEVIVKLNESIEKANVTLVNNTKQVAASIEKKASENKTFSNEKWRNASMAIYLKSNQIDSILTAISTSKSNLEKLKFQEVVFNHFKSLTNRFQFFDSSFELKRRKDIPLETDSFLNNANSFQIFKTMFFKRDDELNIRTSINNLKIILWVDCQHLLKYCSFQITNFDGYYESNQFITSMNKAYFRNGDVLEISAGEAYFSPKSNPKIYIDNQICLINSDGIATFNKKVTTPVGVYFIPIKIEYTKADGQKTWLEKKIKYTVE